VLSPGGVLGLGPYEAPTPAARGALAAVPGVPQGVHLHVRTRP
jgi:hypothetical protein